MNSTLHKKIQHSENSSTVFNKTLLLCSLYFARRNKTLLYTCMVNLCHCKLQNLIATCILAGTEVLSPEYEVFVQYYSEIVHSMSAKSLSPHFVAYNIISQGDQEEILSIASSNKAAMMLLNRVSSAIASGIVDSFYKLLNITEQYGSIDSRDVSLSIRKKLSELKLTKQDVCTPDKEGTQNNFYNR